MSAADDGRPRFDLQSHSLHSDGALSPSAVVARAARAGVELLALTDHDTVAGVEEALMAGRAQGVAVVPAVEISALYGSHEDLHILGYGIDHHAAVLDDALVAYRQDRQARAERMLDAFRALGWAVDVRRLKEHTAAGGSIGRPHIARAVYEHPGNARRLSDEGLQSSTDVLQAYLLPGLPAYRGRTIPTVADAISLIHAVGGLAVWAHPFWDIKDPEETLATLDALVADGLDGVEVFYVTHDEAQIRLLAAACAERGLLSTGSSDFHGPEHAVFSAFRAHELHGLTPNLGAIPWPAGERLTAPDAGRTDP